MKRVRGDRFLLIVVPTVLLAAMLFAQSRSNGKTCSSGLCSPPISAAK